MFNWRVRTEKSTLARSVVYRLRASSLTQFRQGSAGTSFPPSTRSCLSKPANRRIQNRNAPCVTFPPTHGYVGTKEARHPFVSQPAGCAVKTKASLWYRARKTPGRPEQRNPSNDDWRWLGKPLGTASSSRSDRISRIRSCLVIADIPGNGTKLLGGMLELSREKLKPEDEERGHAGRGREESCLLYTSDAADDC